MENNSLELRHDEMEARANIAATNANRNIKKRNDQPKLTEAHAAMYCKIKAIRGKYNKGGFTSIEVPTSWPQAFSDPSNLQKLPDPKQATESKIVDLPDEIVYYLLLTRK
jgi:hypothetical protein